MSVSKSRSSGSSVVIACGVISATACGYVSWKGGCVRMVRSVVSASSSCPAARMLAKGPVGTDSTPVASSGRSTVLSGPRAVAQTTLSSAVETAVMLCRAKLSAAISVARLATGLPLTLSPPMALTSEARAKADGASPARPMLLPPLALALLLALPLAPPPLTLPPPPCGGAAMPRFASTAALMAPLTTEQTDLRLLPSSLAAAEAPCEVPPAGTPRPAPACSACCNPSLTVNGLPRTGAAAALPSAPSSPPPSTPLPAPPVPPEGVVVVEPEARPTVAVSSGAISGARSTPRDACSAAKAPAASSVLLPEPGSPEPTSASVTLEVASSSAVTAPVAIVLSGGSSVEPLTLGTRARRRLVVVAGSELVQASSKAGTAAPALAGSMPVGSTPRRICSAEVCPSEVVAALRLRLK